MILRPIKLRVWLVCEIKSLYFSFLIDIKIRNFYLKVYYTKLIPNNHVPLT